jgi:hypothetical protein
MDWESGMRFLEWSSLRIVSLPWLSEIPVVKDSRLLRIAILSMSRRGVGGNNSEFPALAPSCFRRPFYTAPSEMAPSCLSSMPFGRSNCPIDSSHYEEIDTKNIRFRI